MKTLILLVCIILLPSQLFSQLAPSPEYIKKLVKGQEQELKAHFPNLRVSLSSTTGLPEALSGLEAVAKPTPKAKDAADAVTQFFNEKQVRSLFPAALANMPQASIEIIEHHLDPSFPANTIVTVQQKIGGLRVFGAQAKVTVTEALAVTGATLNFRTVTADVTTNRQLSENQAKNLALKNYKNLLETDHIGKSEVSASGEHPKVGISELVMFDPATLGEKGNQGLRPTWVVKIGTFVFFIDATDGVVLHKYRNLHLLASFQVNDYNLSEDTSKLILDEGGLVPTQVSEEATKALENARVTRAFFRSINRDFLGVSGCDSELVEPQPLNLNIRFSGTDNSYWEPSLRSAFFADGYATAVDVVSHELTHGVTEFSSCMVYDYESGAVSEFISDFFAAMIREQQGLFPWSIGSTLAKHRPPDFPIRSMNRPHLGGFNRALLPADDNNGQPEIASEEVAIDDPICRFDILNSCAHINSGILNRAAFLAVAGDRLADETIIGIGSVKMIAIVNRALSMMANVMTLRSAAADIVQACSDLQRVGKAGIKADDCVKVSKAYQAVGLIP